MGLVKLSIYQSGGGMGQVTAEAKKNYAERIKVYKGKIEKILLHEKNLLAVLSQNRTPDPFKYIALAEDRLNLAAHYLLLNRISVSLLDIKNEAFLNDARRSCYESIIHLEKVVSGIINAPFTELEEYWQAIEGLGDRKRYEIMCKLGFTIESVMDGFGENTKWKWSFVDLHGRYVVVFKNIINFRTLIAGLDPRKPDYEVRHRMLHRIKQLLTKSADDFRLKYELSTNRIDDFQMAIQLLFSLLRIHIILSETHEAEEVKKKIALWKQKMENDSLKQKES